MKNITVSCVALLSALLALLPVLGQNAQNIGGETIEQKDGVEHDYKWLMQIADDLELIASVQVDFSAKQRLEWYKGNTNGFRANLILNEPGQAQTKGARRLLVRVLQNNPSRTPNVAINRPGWLETYQKDIRGQRDFGIGKQLVILSRSIAGFQGAAVPIP